ncbi:MAG: FCD domain-containing protein, partial [Bryobacteraceae bacterium]
REPRKLAAHLDSMMAPHARQNIDPNTLFRIQNFHLSLHMRIAECTGSLALRDAIEKNYVLIFNWLYDVAMEFRMPPRWHRDLIDAVARNDADIAAASMRRHVRHGMDEIQARISSHFGGESTGLEVLPRPKARIVPRNGSAGWRVKNARRD